MCYVVFNIKLECICVNKMLQQPAKKNTERSTNINIYLFLVLLCPWLWLLTHSTSLCLLCEFQRMHQQGYCIRWNFAMFHCMHLSIVMILSFYKMKFWEKVRTAIPTLNANWIAVFFSKKRERIKSFCDFTSDKATIEFIESLQNQQRRWHKTTIER